MVRILIDGYAQEAQMLTYQGANQRCVLTNTCGKADHIYTIHCCYIRTDIFCHTITISLHSADAMLITSVIAIFQIAEIGRQVVGQTIYTGLLVQNSHDLVDVLAFFVSDELHDGGINITGTGSHDQAFQGSQAHGGIYAFAVLHCRYAGAVT